MKCNLENCEINPQVGFEPEESPEIPDNCSESEDFACLTYGGGYIKGIKKIDSVWIDDLEVPEQEIFEVIQEDRRSTLNFSCLVGLGFPELAPNGELLLFDNMMKNGLLSQNLFTAYYYNDGDHSALYFGDIRSEYYTGEIHYVPVQKRYHWNIKIDDIKVNGESTGVCDETEGCQGLVDTGTNSNSFESIQYEVIMQNFGAISCSNINNLPILTYVIDGKDYTLEPSEYMKEDSEECDASFIQMDVFRGTEPPAMVLGVVFMQKYFTIFDRTDDSNPRIGFALANADLEVDSWVFEEVDEMEEQAIHRDDIDR